MPTYSPVNPLVAAGLISEELSDILATPDTVVEKKRTKRIRGCRDLTSEEYRQMLLDKEKGKKEAAKKAEREKKKVKLEEKNKNKAEESTKVDLEAEEGSKEEAKIPFRGFRFRRFQAWQLQIHNTADHPVPDISE